MEENKVVETQSQITEVTGEKTEKRMYEADEFKAVVKQRDEVKQKLRQFEEEKEKTIKLKEEESLKAQGEYTKLIEKVTAERAQEKEALTNLLANNFLTSVAGEFGLAKPEYLKLLPVKVELDGMEIKNVDEVKKSFEEFRKSNPNLFVPPKSVPPTSGVYKKPEKDSTVPRNNHQDMIQAVAEKMATWKK